MRKHRYDIDTMLCATALDSPGPVTVLTSDREGLTALCSGRAALIEGPRLPVGRGECAGQRAGARRDAADRLAVHGVSLVQGGQEARRAVGGGAVEDGCAGIGFLGGGVASRAEGTSRPATSRSAGSTGATGRCCCQGWRGPSSASSPATGPCRSDARAARETSSSSSPAVPAIRPWVTDSSVSRCSAGPRNVVIRRCSAASGRSRSSNRTVSLSESRVPSRFARAVRAFTRPAWAKPRPGRPPRRGAPAAFRGQLLSYASDLGKHLGAGRPPEPCARVRIAPGALRRKCPKTPPSASQPRRGVRVCAANCFAVGWYLETGS